MNGLRRTLARLKKAMAQLVLKGPILRAWVGRKCKILERRYAQELIRRSSAPLAESPKSFWAARAIGLQKILFISDIQWENKELVPELEKICAVNTLNLRSQLDPLAHTPLSDQVCALVSAHIDANPGLEPDFILFYARSALLSEEVFHLLRKRWSCPLAGMNLDDKMEFLPYHLFASGRENYRHWAEFFDLNLTNVRVVSDWYQQEGLAAYYMPEGYHPRSDCPYPEMTSFKNEIAFVGSWRPEREGFFKLLWDRGVPLLAVGDGWPISEPGKNPNAVYRATMINLGLGFASPSQTLTTLKTRDFECPGAGACYLTTYNWELALHYEIGREILCYRSPDELIELFAYYRRRPSECLKIAQAAYERCRHAHTWERRFSLLFQKMGLLPK